MTRTLTSKQRRQKIIEFRAKNNITNCKRCGQPLGMTTHHFLCFKCWKIQKNFPKFDKPKQYKKQGINGNDTYG